MFYVFDQNNSGGFFDVNDKVCHRLFIEADNVYEAIAKAEELGCYWNGVDAGVDCPCCGDRWSCSYMEPIPLDKYKTEGYKAWRKTYYFEGIEEYAQYLANEYGWTNPDGRIFYKDGTVKEIFTERKE